MPLFLLFSVLLALFSCAGSSELKLELVVELFRHGARAPLSDNVPTDNPWPYFSELTRTGMHQHFLAGAHIRKKYIHEKGFLPEEFDPDMFWLRSTDLNRTLMSAGSRFHGLYPKLHNITTKSKYSDPPLFKNSASINRTEPKEILISQMIPVQTVSNVDDLMLGATEEHICPQTSFLHQQQLSTPEWTQVIEAFNPLLDAMAPLFLTNRTNLNLTELAWMFDTFLAFHWDNRTAKLPLSWKDNAEAITNLSTLYNLYNNFYGFGSTDLMKVAATPLLIDIFSKIDDRLSDTPSQPKLKWISYSAHDTNILTLFNAFNLTNWRCQFSKFMGVNTSELCLNGPPFASHIHFELYTQQSAGTGLRGEKKVFIKFIFNGHEYSLCGGSSLCDYHELKERIERDVTTIADVPGFCNVTAYPILEVMLVDIDDFSLMEANLGIFLLNLAFVTVIVLLNKKLSSLKKPKYSYQSPSVSTPP